MTYSKTLVVHVASGYYTSPQIEISLRAVWGGISMYLLLKTLKIIILKEYLLQNRFLRQVRENGVGGGDGGCGVVNDIWFPITIISSLVVSETNIKQLSVYLYTFYCMSNLRENTCHVVINNTIITESQDSRIYIRLENMKQHIIPWLGINVSLVISGINVLIERRHRTTSTVFFPFYFF